MIGFIFGALLGMAAGGYLAYRYNSTIADWLED